ncbi:C-type lectin domain family 4 member F-like [Esox lucius]|uniref:C-type lectin domain family 4 member F-like n=1 Tax=Esox lucius TaxID=8010 RepID=UPI001476E7DE|nr:C-type lectin domain family 4 member F-like [Esox lucius]
MSEGTYECEGNVTSTNIDCPIYGNEGVDKPKPCEVVIQHSDGIIGRQYFTERNKLQISNKNLTEERDQLQASYKTRTEERDKLQRDIDIFQRLLVKSPNGSKVFGNSIYYVSTEKNDWEYANLDCLKRGAQLVIINNQEEQKFLITLNIRSWIGLTDRETEGTWKWVDDTPLTTATTVGSSGWWRTTPGVWI